MGTLNVEEVDLAAVTERIRRRTGGELLQPELAGRTTMRDMVADDLRCSLLEAETIVDTLVARGFVRSTHDSDGRALWRIG